MLCFISSLVANVPHIQVPYIATSLKSNKRVFSASFVYIDFISTQQLSQTSTKLYLLLNWGLWHTCFLLGENVINATSTLRPVLSCFLYGSLIKPYFSLHLWLWKTSLVSTKWQPCYSITFNCFRIIVHASQSNRHFTTSSSFGFFITLHFLKWCPIFDGSALCLFTKYNT